MKHLFILTIYVLLFTVVNANENKQDSLFQIKIKNLSGEIIPIQVRASYTIENIKHQLCGKTDITPENQIIIFKGEQLENKKTVKECKIRHNAMLYIVKVSQLNQEKEHNISVQIK